MKLINLLVVALSVAACLTPVITNDALAHGGRTNSDGCHNDKKNNSSHRFELLTSTPIIGTSTKKNNEITTKEIERMLNLV